MAEQTYGNYWIREVDGWVCRRCGCVVQDTDLHDKWHENMKRSTEEKA